MSTVRPTSISVSRCNAQECSRGCGAVRLDISISHAATLRPLKLCRCCTVWVRSRLSAGRRSTRSASSQAGSITTRALGSSARARLPWCMTQFARRYKLQVGKDELSRDADCISQGQAASWLVYSHVTPGRVSTCTKALLLIRSPRTHSARSNAIPSFRNVAS